MTGSEGATAASRAAAEAIDPDVDLHVGSQRAETSGRGLWQVVGAVAAGGAIGASARYGVSLTLPVGEDGFPWGTLLINAVGSGLIGVLMVLVSERGQAHPLVRPFLGTGVLGGFTTFSTYALEISALLERRDAGTALAYAAGTLAAALGAVWAAAAATRAVVARAAGTREAVPR